MVEAAANSAAGLMGRDAVGTAIERLRRNPEIERLEPRKPTAESRAGMAHTEVYSTRHNLGLEQAVKDMAGDHGGRHRPRPAGAGRGREGSYPAGAGISAERGTNGGNSLRHGSGADAWRLSRGRRARARPPRCVQSPTYTGSTATRSFLRPSPGAPAVALGDDCDARPYCVDKLFGPIQEKWRRPTPFALLLPRI